VDGVRGNATVPEGVAAAAGGARKSGVLVSAGGVVRASGSTLGQARQALATQELTTRVPPSSKTSAKGVKIWDNAMFAAKP
jgi:hypothetical protein